MSNIKLNCCGCGKELGLGSRVSTDGVLWRCEECAIKQREEYDNKDKKIADLEAKLAEKEKEIARLKLLVDGFDKLKQYDKDAKQIILINPDNIYADGHKLVIKQANQDKI